MQMSDGKIESNEHRDLTAPYFTFVWAEDRNGLIGQAGRLPWNLPNDLKHFKNVTTGDVVLMGRKTYESIPKRPLANRINIILTRNKEYVAEGAVICHTKEEVLEYVKDIQKPIHVIGGSTIFEIFADEVNVLYRTIIDEEFVGDTYMTDIPYKHFRCIEISDGVVDERNQYPHQFFVYERKQFVDPFTDKSN